MGKPAKLVRDNPGFAALGFLVIFSLLIQVLKLKIWKDIHQAVEFWGSIVVVSRLFC